MFYLASILSWTFYRAWSWPPTIFFVLHGLVMLMKQHSYAFYNGHLSELYKYRKSLQEKLKQLQNVTPAQSPSATAFNFSTSFLDQSPPSADFTHRRRGSHSLG